MTQAPEVIHPVQASQIEAANRLRTHIYAWVDTDEAFDLLKRNVPGFSPEASLLKAAAINDLYATNVYAMLRMAKHIHEVMLDPPREPVALVEQIAVLTGPEGETRRHVSFASKFVHFFVDAEATPIYDRYAVESVTYHMGRGLVSTDNPDYRPFAEAIFTLRQVSGLDCSTRAMDHYLWLAGMYRCWLKDPKKATLSLDVQRLFESGHAEIATDLAILVEASGRHFRTIPNGAISGVGEIGGMGPGR